MKTPDSYGLLALVAAVFSSKRMTQSVQKNTPDQEPQALFATKGVSLWGPFLLIAYVATGIFGLHFNNVNTFAAPIWAPTGIALAGVLLGGYELSIWIFVAAFFVNLYQGAPYAVAFVIAFGNTLETIVGAWILKRLTDSAGLFRTLRDTLLFIAVAYVTPIISASIGTGILWLSGRLLESQILVTWLAWRSGDALGALVVTPLILVWATPYKYPIGPLKRHIGETISLGITLVAVNALNFIPIAAVPIHVPLLYLVSLPLAWAAVRFGPRGVALATFTNLLLALVATAHGTGPFVNSNYQDGLLFLQIYIAVTATTFLIFGAIVKELTGTRDSLENHVGELEYALRKIRSEDKAKADFLAELAHELRNPLAPVVSALEMIGLRGLSSAEGEEAVTIIRKQTSTMAQLLNDLLDISRVSRRKVSLTKKTLDLRAATAGALETVEAFMQTRRQRLIVALGQKPLWVDADPLRLEQIIVNLLNNAAKYTNQGGTIRVSARKKDNLVILSVEDNGIGIPKDMLTRIFEPFLQGSHGTSTRAAGLGIGLSLTKHLVELHRGSIEVFSDGPGKGSEFVVRIPSARPPTTESVESPTQTPLQLAQGAKTPVVRTSKSKKRRVLIVDDNERAAQTLSRLVAFRGHEVHVVYDGPSALAIVPEVNPQIAILDIGLPQMDGYELARRLREMGKPLTLVALTGYGLEEDKRKALVAGFDYHLVKPVSFSDLEPILN